MLIARILFLCYSYILYLQVDCEGEDDDEGEEAFEYTGAFESVDIVRHFIAAMQKAEQMDAAFMAQLRGQLTPEDQEHLQAYIAEAARPPAPSATA